MNMARDVYYMERDVYYMERDVYYMERDVPRRAWAGDVSRRQAEPIKSCDVERRAPMHEVELRAP